MPLRALTLMTDDATPTHTHDLTRSDATHKLADVNLTPPSVLCRDDAHSYLSQRLAPLLHAV